MNKFEPIYCTVQSVPTFTATIYVGLRVGRSTDAKSLHHTLDDVRRICQDYCDEIGLCVTVTPTRFIYKAGGEDGAAVGLINYPRFPSDPSEIKNKALVLAERLRIACNQWKVSLVFPDETVMLSQNAPEAP